MIPLVVLNHGIKFRNYRLFTKIEESETISVKDQLLSTSISYIPLHHERIFKVSKKQTIAFQIIMMTLQQLRKVAVSGAGN